MKPKDTFKIVKNFVKNDEALALEKACEKLKTTARFLRAKHTDKVFVFEKIR